MALRKLLNLTIYNGCGKINMLVGDCCLGNLRGKILFICGGNKMVITNWLAKKDGQGGLAFPSEFESGDVRIYGNVFLNPNFPNGEYVQTANIVSYRGGKVITSTGSEYTLLKEAQQYFNFLKATERGHLILKNWQVCDGKLVGVSVDGSRVEGVVIGQSFKSNVCKLKDGRTLFVDWLSMADSFMIKPIHEDLLLFCTEKCMPDIFCKHYNLFREKNCR